MSQPAQPTISPQHVDLIRSSYIVLEPQAQRLIELFYENLFITAPHVRALFPDDDTDQREHLRDILALIVLHVDRLDELERVLVDMGVRNAERGVEPGHYAIVRDVLILSLAHVADDLWYCELQEAWTLALDAVARIMLLGAEQGGRLVRRAA